MTLRSWLSRLTISQYDEVLKKEIVVYKGPTKLTQFIQHRRGKCTWDCGFCYDEACKFKDRERGKLLASYYEHSNTSKLTFSH